MDKEWALLANMPIYRPCNSLTGILRNKELAQVKKTWSLL